MLTTEKTMEIFKKRDTTAFLYAQQKKENQMSTYLTPVTVPVRLDVTEQRAILTGKKQSVTIKRGSIIGFRGLDTVFQVSAIHPNGLTMINSDTSYQRFYSWKNLFLDKHNSIWRDCLDNTGWMVVT